MPSGEHIELTRRAISWMRPRVTNSGQRWASEIKIADGYVADAGTIANLQFRFFEELAGGNDIKWDRMFFLFEAKVSRADYFNMFHPEKKGNRWVPVANVHYIVTPKGMVDPDEVPTFWGLLEKSHQGLRQIKKPIYCEMSEVEMWRMGYLILWGGYSRRANIEDWEIRKQGNK